VAPEAQLSTAPISVNLTLVEVQSTPTTVGSTLTGTLNNQNPAAYYTFEGTSSDLLRLSGERISGNEFDVSVYNSAGMGFGGSSTLYGPESGSFVVDPLQLTETGTFLMVVRRAFMPDGSDQGESQYSVTLEMTQTPILQAGQPIQGSFAPNTYENVYRFEGTAGQSIRISIRSMTPDYAPALSINGPALPLVPDQPENYVQPFYAQISGNTSANATYEVVLPADGSYLFRVGNGNYSPDGQLKGSYTLQVDIAQ
jgi:hypothetical protein